MLHAAAFALVVMNIPKSANIGATDELGAYFDVPNRTLALVTAVMLGLGDAAINNVIYSTVSTVWKEESASAFALMKEKVSQGQFVATFSTKMTFWVSAGNGQFIFYLEIV